MLMVSARDLEITFPVTFKATLYFDAVLGTWTGTDWFYEPIFEGDTSINIFQKTITLDMAGDVSWAGDGALSFANFQGNVEFDLTNGFEITGGNVQNETKYYTKLGGGWGESSYFTGTPGVQLSWQDGPGGPACAYIKAETIDITDLLDGNLSINNELCYWSPGA